MKRHLRIAGSLQRPVSAHAKSTRATLGYGFIGKVAHPRRIEQVQNTWFAAGISSTVTDVRRFVSSDVEAVWRQTTNRLLESPIGSFDQKMWSESHMAILWWLINSDGDSVRMPLNLLDRMCEEEEATLETEEGTQAKEFFQTDLLNLVVNHWRKLVSDRPTFLQAEQDLHPQALVDKMHHFHKKSKHLKPNTQTYAMIIDGISACSSKTSQPNDGVLVAERVLDWLIESSLEYPHLCPNVVTFSSMMNAWAKSGRAEAAEKVEKLLEDMKHLHMEYPDWDVAPNQITYATAIDTWAKVGQVDRVEELLKEMHAEYRQGEEGLKPNLTAFNGYLVALAKNGEMDKAESVLEQMEDLYSSEELTEPPNVISYSTVLDAFAKSKHVGAAERAESILRQMIDQGVSPNAVSYNSVINAFVKSRNVERAEALLNEMYESFVQGNPEVKPTMQTYSLVLSAWAKTRSPQAGDRGEKILNLMKDLAESGEIDAPDIIAYNTLLDCWAKSSAKDSAEKARAFLEKMAEDGVNPDTYSYNIVIYAMAHAGSITNAEVMLDTMSVAGVTPDATTYNTLLAAWNKSSLNEAPSRATNLFVRMKQDNNVESDIITYNIMLQFYSKAGNAERAEALFDEMCQEQSSVGPDSVSFNTVISAWSRSRRSDASKRAEVILNKMLEFGGRVRPNSITFNSVMGAWVKSKSPEAAERCERIFGVMNDMYEDGHALVKPDVVTYNTLIHAWSLSHKEEAPDRAESVFRDMERQYETGDRRLKPTAKTYGSLISVWSKSRRRNAGRKGEDYLRTLIEKAESGQIQEQPRVFEFTATIRAWANSGDPKAIYKADEILHLLLKELRKGNKRAQPDSKVFGTILMLLASSSLPDKAKYADKIVRLMKDYQVEPDSFNVRQLKKCYADRIQQRAAN